MRYVGKIYRPPSEARSFILQATIGCSWNHCTYCDMYREKEFSVRPLDQTLEDIDMASAMHGEHIEKVFVADGDALVMDMTHWESILETCKDRFPRLRQVSAYATAMNILSKSDEELRRLRTMGLAMLYVGPETGDDVTFKRIAKGAGFSEHAEAARRAHEAGFVLSTIFLLGAGGVERSAEHAAETARLITAMDPRYFSLLTLTIVPGTPISKLAERGKFTLPSKTRMLEEMRTIVAETNPRDAVFRTNHASNYLPIGGNMPTDRKAILDIIDRALTGQIELKPEWARGL